MIKDYLPPILCFSSFIFYFLFFFKIKKNERKYNNIVQMDSKNNKSLKDVRLLIKSSIDKELVWDYQLALIYLKIGYLLFIIGIVSLFLIPLLSILIKCMPSITKA